MTTQPSYPNARDPMAGLPPWTGTADPRRRTRAPWLDQGAQNPVLSRPPRPPRPVDLSEEAQRRFNEVLDLHDRLADVEPRALLDVPEDPTPEDVQEGFARQMQRFHPDRLPPELAVLKPYAMRIVVQLNAARARLAQDAQRRLAARPSLPVPTVLPAFEPGPSPALEARFEKAAALCELAQTMAEKKDYTRAAALMLRARMLDGDNAEYAALHAWLLYERDGQPREASEDTRRLLEHALELDDGCLPAHWYQALVLEAAGECERALVHYRRVAELDPEHAGAARKLRLHAALTAASGGDARLLPRLRAFLRRS